jgi:exodeoxyribonuclease VII small subunit
VPDDDSTRDRSPSEEPLSFEQALLELQQVVDHLEEGTVGLEESMRLFEHGTAMLRHCYTLLEHAEQRIEILTGQDAAGNVETAPFDASASHESHAPKAGRRARKPSPRSRPASPSDDANAGDTLFS